ncbi:MAG: TlpA family protein disulfide reductase [Bacteroidales bacterium]|jgi:thiol-disulfide isomerase/thioredoxin|nr:TlpA family protein disulfide reductase [Bacteroidales bacterium]
MKNTILLSIILMLSVSLLSQTEGEDKKGKKLPAVEIKTLDGKVFNTTDIQNDGKPVIISLWATWCKPCIAELMAIADVYEDWVEETGVKLYAISVDDAKTAARVAPFVNGRAWEYEVLLDQNWDFKRAMGVADIPFLCILNGKGEIVWQHTSYAPGSEEEVFEIVKKIAAEGK